MTMTMAGPQQARSGEVVSHTLNYNLGVTNARLRIDWTGVTYVSAQRLSGAGASAPEFEGTSPEGQPAQLSWVVEQGSGALEVTLQIPQGTASNAVSTRAWVSGVCAPRSNSVATAVVAE